MGYDKSTCSIIYRNYYHWFERESKGVYILSAEGKMALESDEYAEVVEFYRNLSNWKTLGFHPKTPQAFEKAWPKLLVKYRDKSRYFGVNYKISINGFTKNEMKLHFIKSFTKFFSKNFRGLGWNPKVFQFHKFLFSVHCLQGVRHSPTVLVR